MLLLVACFCVSWGCSETVSKHNQTMNKITNLFSLRRVVLFLFLITNALTSSIVFAQTQTIGSFPFMDGGFENQTTGVLGTTLSSAAWSRQNQSGASSSIVTTSPRSGTKHASAVSVSTVSRNLQSPQSATASAGPAANTSYVVQFFVQNAASVNSFQAAVTTNGTSNPAYSTAATLAANATWTKVSYVLSTATTAVTTSGIGIAGRAAAGSFFVDDFVIYPGSAIDNTAPNSPGTVTVSAATSSTLNVSWAAATGGVDGGGYVVVRYASAPNADNDINQNGIYGVGNTTSNGTGSLVGTVRYVGTGTSFTDTGLSQGTQYWYKVYTADKAFNYSAESSGNGSTTSAYSITYANIQYPDFTTSINEGSSITYYGQVYSAGLTDSAGEGTLIDAWLGYSTTNSDPSGAGWTWVPATYNTDVGNNDEYKAALTGLTPATYYLAYRYRIGAGSYVYGDINGIWNSTTDNRILTVTSLLVDWCNVQYPTSGTITAGDAYNVYAKVYLGGVTNAGSPGAGITAWIGYSTSNTNPNTWTNWVPATFNADQGNDDEYFANIATGLTSGTYYYASRFQRTGSTEYRYGDINGIWDTTADNGVLTVNAATPVVTPASPTGTYNTAFSYNVVATNAPTSYAVASGTLPTGLSLNTTTGLISGTPTQVGTFAVGVTAANGGGTSAAATITITISQASQTITFGTLASKVYGDAAFALSATASSGLTVSYSSSNTAVATVSGDTVIIVGAGSTTITASQAGDVNNTAATAVNQTLTVAVKNLTITGVVADDKVQDGTTTATLSGAPGLSGLVSGDESAVSITGTPTATFASALPGVGIAVTVTGYSLAGTKASNYSVSQPTGLTADITALTVPTATAATAVLPVGFTAKWNAVSGATSYELDVYIKTGGVTEVINQDFTWTNLGTTNGTGGNSGGWSGSIATNTFDIVGWTDASGYRGDNCAKLGTGSARGALTTPVFGTAGNAVVTFRAGAWDSASEQTTLLLEVTGGGTLSQSSVTMTKGAFANYTVNVTGATAATQVTFRAFQISNARFFIDDIVVTVDSESLVYASGYQSLNVGNFTAYAVTGLDPETQYFYRVRAVNGTVATGSSNEISVTTKPVSCTWNGTAWTNTTGPDADIEAVIAGVYSTAVNGEITAKKVTVNSGSLTVNSGNTITVVNELVNNLTAADVVVENNANLIQTADVDNTGSVTVKRNSSLIKRLDYTLWSSPVVGQNLLNFSPQTLTNRFYLYNSTTNFYESVPSPSTTTFDAGKGFLIRVPNNHPAVTPTAFAGQFVGVPHNGDYSVTMQDAVAGERFNLVGNPYPSPINALSFIEDANNSGSITGTLYFWRKTNGSANPSYCTWTSGGFVTNNDDQTFDLNDVIQTGQAFFVEATGTNNQLLFTNAMRADNNANQFFRNAQTTTSVERNRVWLNATNGAGAFSQTMIGYMTNASNGFDAQIDGKYINDGEIALTSLLGANPMAIQGRALPFDAADVVPMRFKATTAGTYTIAIDHVDGIFANDQTVFLRDNVLGVTHNLNDGAYTFAVEAGTFDSRFEVVYQATLGTDTPTLTQNQVVVYAADASSVTVATGTIVMNSIKVFDIRGRLLTESNAINASQATLALPATNQVVLLQITAVTGETITKKFVK
ncbi:MAG: hypothetical protein CUR32_05545 [Flavobacterium sp.]|nr:MAG: hypothetical protein CUR32_05545 [Flavobacterium sp.] [Flavobacterium sp. FEMGT703F]